MTHNLNVYQFPIQVDPAQFFRKSGWVYVLANGCMPDLYKVGRTTGSVQARMRQLYTTGLPMPFDCMFAEWFCDCHEAEKFIHQELEGTRIDYNREFFGADLKEIELAFMNYSASVEDIPDSMASLYSYRRKKAEESERVNGALVARSSKRFSSEAPF